MIHPEKIRKGRQGATWFALVLTVLILGISGGIAAAEDLDITISKGLVQRFMNAITPYHIDYEPIEGVKAAEVVIQNPRLILEPGDPGRIYLEFDYIATSSMLGIDGFKGTTRPRLDITYLPQKAVLKLEAKNFNVQADKMKIKLDGLLPPYYVLISPEEPMDLEGIKVKVAPKSFKTKVTEKGIRVLADYTFERLP